MVNVNTPATVEAILELLEDMRHEHYGEHVTMLDHSLQTAAVAQASGASEELVVAALLHDVGHVLGDAGEWGYPDHAELGAHWLASSFPPAVTEPIRLHVDAKRYLVSTDPTYVQRLSQASVESLREQGGPFDDNEVAAFAAESYAEAATNLRRWDDDGKTVGVNVIGANSYRESLQRLTGAMTSPSWARDACRCNDCRDPDNGQRLFDIAALGDLQVIAESLTSTHRLIDVSDAFGSIHTCEIPLKDSSHGSISRKLWDASKANSLSVHSGNGDLTDFARELAETGIALANGLPTASGTVLDFANRIGFIRTTNYGELFEVRTDPNPTNLAYTSVGLPLHTDNPYRDPVPTVQLLHCLQPAAIGGASMFADGFAAAERLRSDHPEDFEILATTQLPFRFKSHEADLRAEQPTITLDTNDRVIRVTVNNRSMETPEPWRGAEAFYAAYRRFAKILTSPDVSLELTLAAGELVAFDNRRVLHGRSGYEADPNRHLQGCYIDIDAVRSLALLHGSD